MRRVISLLMAVLFIVSIPVSAMALEVNVSYGDVSIGDTQVTHTKEEGGSAVTEDHGGSVTVTGTTTENNVSVNVSAGNTVEVILQDVNIDTSSTGDGQQEAGKAAVEISGAGDVVVELDGENSLTSPYQHAGLETSQEGGKLTIQDANNDGGSLTAQGGTDGAGIGGGRKENGSNIEINSGIVEAIGGTNAAGIGGGWKGSGSNIEISGGEVTAIGGANGGAGIGGGS